MFIFALAIIFFSTATLTAFVQEDKKRGLTKAELKKMFGKSVSCDAINKSCLDDTGKQIRCSESAANLCLKDKDASADLTVKYDAEGYIWQIKIAEKYGFRHSISAAYKIAEASGGKFVKKIREPSASLACLITEQAEYENLILTISENGCLTYLQTTAVLRWKN